MSHDIQPLARVVDAIAFAAHSAGVTPATVSSAIT